MVVFLNSHIYFCCSRECCDAVLLLTTKLPLTFHQHEVIRKRLRFLFWVNLSFKTNDYNSEDDTAERLRKPS